MLISGMPTVTKGIPIPTPMGRPPKWPFTTVEVGDFFFSPRKSNTLTVAASNWGKKLGKKFQTRMIWAVKVNGEWKPCAASVDGATRGVGVWRVE
jgi:hypothetical protein